MSDAELPPRVASVENLAEVKAELSRERRLRENSEKQYNVLKMEFLAFKQHVDGELQKTATEQVALHSKIIDQSVELAEAKAMIDDLTWRPSNSRSQQISPVRQIIQDEDSSKGIMKMLFGGEKTPPLSEGTSTVTADEVQAELVFFKARCAELQQEKEELAKEFEDRFAEWKHVLLDRVASERKLLKDRITNGNFQSGEDEQELNETSADLDFMFDQVDWTQTRSAQHDLYQETQP